MSTAIHLDGIRKMLGGREILKGVSFDVETGDIFGYLGPNGAGKTTTIRILLGLLEANAGTLEILGQDIHRADTRLKIGFSLDPDGLYDTMTAAENLDFFAAIYGLADAETRSNKVLELVDLADRAADRVGTYSKGMRQRLALARAMVHDPDVLILDEPTSGVDPMGQIEIRQLLTDIARRENKTVLLSSHNLDEVQRICNRVALIDRGEIKLYGHLEELRRTMGQPSVIVKTGGTVADDVIAALGQQPKLGFREQNGTELIFEPDIATEVSEIIGFLAARGVKIEQAGRREYSLEDIYSKILTEAEVEQA